MHTNIWKLYVIKASKWFAVYIPIIIPFYQDNGLTLTHIMILRSVSAATMAFTTVPLGHLADRWGKRTAIIGGTILTALAFSVYSLTGNFWGFACAEFLLAIGVSAIDGADSALLYESVKKHQPTGINYTKYEGRALALGNVSEAAASFVGGAIAVIGSLRFTFYTQVIISLIGVIAALKLRETTFSATVTTVPVNIKTPLQHIWRNKMLLSMLLASAIMTYAILQTTWLVQPLLQKLQFPVIWFGVVWGILQLFIALGSWQAYRLEQKTKNIWVVIGLLITMSVAIIVIAVVQPVLSLLALIIFYSARGLYGPLLREYVNTESPHQMRATILSYRSMFPRIIFMTLGPLIGYIADQTSLDTAFMIFGVGVGGASLLAVVLLVRETHD